MPGRIPVGDHPSGGSEEPTLLERIVLALRLPYPVGALVLALWLPAARLVFNLVETANLAEAFDIAFLQPEGAPLWQRIGIQILGPAHVFYAFWIIRYMRRKTAAGESELAPLLPRGRTAYREAFAALSRPGPPILIGAMILVPSILLSAPTWIPLEVLLFLPPQMILYLAYGTWGYVYFTALGGLLRLSQEPLKLKPFYEDRVLGTRPFGTLCLSLAAAFLGMMALLTAQFPLTPTPVPLPSFLFSISIITLPAIAAAVAFLLPLRAVHRQLVQAKETEQARVGSRVAGVLESLLGDSPRAPAPSLGDIQTLVAADLADRQVSTILTWPVGNRILRRFAVAALSLVVATLGRVILYMLQL